MSDCPHDRLLKGTHESFRAGWLCEECGQFVKLDGLHDLDEYAVVLAALKVGKEKFISRADAG
jgi:hypothetical protein